MKKLLLSGIAALFLATGAASAAEGDFNCDQLPKYYLGGHFSKERTTKDATNAHSGYLGASGLRPLPKQAAAIPPGNAMSCPR
jgi:hypothetical protein